MPHCCICDQTVNQWLPYPHAAQRSPLMALLDTIGSDLSVYQCPACGCNDRDRHLWLYMQATGITEQLSGATILHMAPEVHLERLIQARQPEHYIRGDLHPTRAHHRKLNLEQLDIPDGSIDLMICNHVLEHVQSPEQALSEVRRVLRPGGLLIAQTPYAPKLKHTFELHTPSDAQTAHLLFGQSDHVRLFGSDFLARVHASGLQGDLLAHTSLLPEIDPAQAGCNAREPFFVFWKPQVQADTTAAQQPHQEAVPV